MDRHQSKITILVCLAISLAIVLFGLKFRNQSSGDTSVPPAVPKAQASQLTDVDSPDGKMSLTLEQKEGDGTVTYAFLITDRENGSRREIFFKTVTSGTVISVPDNTFSSDNKYMFFKEVGMGVSDYYVLTTSGDPVYKDLQSFNFSGLFAEKHKDYVITDATGWAGPALVVVNTDKSGGGKGPSFWFDVAGKSFIQLSNRFD